MGPPAARRPADRRPAALPARPAAPRSATGPLVPVTHNAQRGHAHGSAPWSSGRAAAIVRKQPGAEHQPLALKQRRGRARRPAKIPCGRLFVRRRGRLDACCEPGGASKSNPPSPPACGGVQRVCGRLAASEKATGHDGASSGPHWPELPRPGVDGRSCAGRLPEASRANVSAASPLLGPSTADLPG